MLALEIEFLLGRYSATDFRDRDQAEWPPHPARLFSALTAAVFEAGLGESARAALLWLESLSPPEIRADERPARQMPVTVFVPVNDPAEDVLPQRAERQPRSFPSVAPQPPAVHFIWPEAKPDTPLLDQLAVIAKHVTYLGSSRSPVRVRVTNSAPRPNWIPDESGDTVLRVPQKGRLRSLAWHYENGLRPPVGTFQRYRCGERPEQPPSLHSDFGEMVVFRLGGPVAMEIETTLKLTDALRAAAMRRAQEILGSVPTLLSGHDEDGRPSSRPHAAYISLPFVSDRQRYADGRVLGLAVVLPRQTSFHERRQVMEAVRRIDHLRISGVGQLELERLTADQFVPYNLQPSTWAGPQRRWSSATPVLLDRFPKRNGRNIEAIITRSLKHVSLPRPVEVITDRFSPLHGVEPSFRFVTRRRAASPSGVGLARRPILYTHVTVTFAQPVQGPILLGGGRYFGLGLLRPLQEEPTP